MSDSNDVTFELVTPERLMVSQPVHMVVVPGSEGDFGVLIGHTPMLSELRPGTISIYGREGTVSERLFVEGGFAEVTPERCTVLAQVAHLVKSLSEEEVNDRVDKAKTALEKASTEEATSRAKDELARAQAMRAALDDARADRAIS